MLKIAQDQEYEAVKVAIASISKAPAPDGIDWAEVQSIISKTTKREPIDEHEVRCRLFGNPASKSHKGIKGYNAFQLSIGQPWHCVGILRLAELLTLWGQPAMKWLKGEAKGVAHIPARPVDVALP